MNDQCRGGCKTAAPLPPRRADMVRQAFLLEWLTVIWMVVEMVIALWAGVTAHSVSLIAFGVDSCIELASAGVLLWRLTVEIKQGQDFSETAEATASRIAGALLFALAAYVVASAGWSLWSREGAEFSWPGFVVTVTAIPAMALLARRKLRVAEALGSRALRADAMESITCGYLSVVVVTGLLAQAVTGAWWVDGVTSLAIVWLLVKEGREAWQGEECSCMKHETK